MKPKNDRLSIWAHLAGKKIHEILSVLLSVGGVLADRSVSHGAAVS